MVCKYDKLEIMFVFVFRIYVYEFGKYFIMIKFFKV